MKIHLSFESLDEILRFGNAAIDAHPDCVILPVDSGKIGKPPAQYLSRAACDEELTLDDLSLYEAGRLRVYYHLVEIGFFTLEQVSKVMDISTKELTAMRDKWGLSGSITAQRDAIREMALRDACDGCDRLEESRGRNSVPTPGAKENKDENCI